MLTLYVTLPDHHPATEPIFLAGTLNGWQTGDERFRLTYDEALQVFVIQLPTPAEGFEYKFTRGAWSSEEVDPFGNPISNRVWTMDDGSVGYLHIENWRDRLEQSPRATGQVFCWQEALYMPELNRYRRIWVYLPPQYDQQTQRYPVLYMHDAQNLFAATERASENWHVDDALNRLYANTGWACIVVGIEHGETLRLAEYSVVPNPEHGGGEGQAYLAFLTNTLKPLVDATFRTVPDAANTALIGSSMGGLISVYAALLHGDVFGKVAAFSLSLWWSDDVYRLAAAVPYNFVHKLVLLGGQRESTSMLPDLLALYYTLIDNGYFEHKIHLDFYNDGAHAEWFWGREFERAVRWLFDETMAPIAEQPLARVDKTNREIRLLQPFVKAELLNGYGKVIYSLDGTTDNAPNPEQVMPLQPHWHGLFALQCLLPNQRIELQKIVL